MLERPQTLDRLLLHVRRRATVIPADSASWNRRILTPFSGLAGVGRALSSVSRVLARYFSLEFHGFLSFVSGGGVTRTTMAVTYIRSIHWCRNSWTSNRVSPWTGTSA